MYLLEQSRVFDGNDCSIRESLQQSISESCPGAARTTLRAPIARSPRTRGMMVTARKPLFRKLFFADSKLRGGVSYVWKVYDFLVKDAHAVHVFAAERKRKDAAPIVCAHRIQVCDRGSPYLVSDRQGNAYCGVRE